MPVRFTLEEEMLRERLDQSALALAAVGEIHNVPITELEAAELNNLLLEIERFKLNFDNRITSGGRIVG